MFENQRELTTEEKGKFIRLASKDPALNPRRISYIGFATFERDERIKVAGDDVVGDVVRANDDFWEKLLWFFLIVVFASMVYVSLQVLFKL